MKLRLLSISLFLASCSHPMPVSGEFFNKTEVIFLEDTLNQPKKFIASGKRVSISFQSYSDADASDIDVFPEPPVVIGNKETGASCKILDGGIWVRAEVYLSSNENYALMNEYSGSGSDLVVYDTSTCLEVERLDVSGVDWSIAGNKLNIGGNCSNSEPKNCASSGTVNLELLIKNKSPTMQ